MKIKFVIAATLLTASAISNASDFLCKVYCTSSIVYVKVNADSKSDAAYQIDRQGLKTCKSDNKMKTSNQAIRPEQCSPK